MACLQKGWTEMSFMLSRRCYVATVTFQSRYDSVQPFGQTKNELLHPKGWWLLDGFIRLRSAEIYDPGCDLLFRLGLDDLV